MENKKYGVCLTLPKPCQCEEAIKLLKENDKNE